jgi:hypothetical protein
MKCTKRSFIAICIVLTVPLSLSIGNAKGATSAAAHAQTAKQQCMNICRARYRACFSLKQIPSSQCRGIYQDCARYSCTGLGPG